MSRSSRHRDLERWLARADTGGLLLGAVVSGAVLAAVSGHASGSTRVAISALAVLVVYWMAHVYVRVLSEQLGGSDTRVLPQRLPTSFWEEATVLLGGLPAVVVYVVAVALGASPPTAGYVALFFLVALLFVAGFVGAHRAGLTGAAAFFEAAGAGFFGVLIVIMKAALH